MKSTEQELEARLAQLTRHHALMREVNRSVRRDDPAALARLGFDDSQIEAAFRADHLGRRGFYPYQLNTSSARIGRCRRRLARLKGDSR